PDRRTPPTHGRRQGGSRHRGDVRTALPPDPAVQGLDRAYGLDEVLATFRLLQVPDAEDAVLELVDRVPRADPQDHASAADVVDRGGELREQPRGAERRPRDQGSDVDAARTPPA